MNRQMLRRNGASVYIERGMSFKSFFLNKKDLNSYMCYFIFIFARTVTAEDMIRISASLNFFRLSFRNCLSCVFNFEDLLIIYYTLYSLSVLSLAKSLQFIFDISAANRLVSYLLADEWLICRLRVQCIIFKSNVNLCSFY